MHEHHSPRHARRAAEEYLGEFLLRRPSIMWPTSAIVGAAVGTVPTLLARPELATADHAAVFGVATTAQAAIVALAGRICEHLRAP